MSHRYTAGPPEGDSKPHPSSARKRHWEETWAARAPQELSWHQPEPRTSLELIEACGLGPEEPIVDAGGGASPLVDRLLARGHRRLTILDLSGRALALARGRLGPRADLVSWVEADVTTWEPPSAAYALWHDRAVFHFLVEEVDRRAYLERLERALRPGGWVVLGTFALEGPERCSGLPVRRYGPEEVQQAFGPGFRLVEERRETHRTPGGREQAFAWFRLHRPA